MYGSSWRPFRIRFVCSLALVACVANPLRAQDEAVVESLAGILAASDTRRFTGPLFRAASRHPDPIVRSHAALAMGRIGNQAAVPVLLRLMSDPDSIVRRDAVFAVGQLGSSDALARLRDIVLNTPPEEYGAAQVEAVAAVAKIGGPEAAAVIAELLNRWVGIASTQSVPRGVRRALSEAWRLGHLAPVTLITQFAEAANGETRWRAVFSLSRLSPPEASNVLLRVPEDPEPLARAFGVRALTAGYADRVGLDRRGLAARVRRAVEDPDPHVRIQAVKALGTFGTSDHVSIVADRAADNDGNVRVQALASLGMMVGAEATDVISRQLEGGVFATRREAILSLARVGGASVLPHIRSWMARPGWADRATAANALRWVPYRLAQTVLATLLGDMDGRVVAAAVLTAVTADWPLADSLARVHVTHADPGVRKIAVRRLAHRPDTVNVQPLVRAFEVSMSDRTTHVQIEVVGALGRVAALNQAAAALVANRFLARFPTVDDYLVRRAAEQGFPEAANRWGPAQPISTGRGIEDYRALARELVLPAARGEYQTEMVVETDRGNVIFELFAADAPFTVQAFIRLVDRRYFDGLAWYRVEPGTALEAGDRRGDGLGRDIPPVRDEINPRPFERGVLGLVLDGPDTGGSRFFVTLSPQPALEGTYTAFGRVVSGMEVLERLTMGDRIRRVRRQ